MQSAVEKQFLDLERQYWQALQDRDDETALRLRTTHASSAAHRGWPASTGGRWRGC